MPFKSGTTIEPMPHAPVYLDYHATTPVDRRVVEAMLPYFTECFGNPASSMHQWGWKAQEAVEQARRDVATLIGATPREIVFTSGATESNNLAIQGIAADAPAGKRHVIVSAIEHKSVLEAAHRLERAGWRVTELPVSRDGLVDPASLDRALTGDTALVSVMAANNEIGVIQPLAADRRGRARPGRAAPRRRGAGRRKDSDRRPRDAHRSAVPHGPQDVRAEGVRRALRAKADGACAAHHRRRTGTRAPVRHVERPRDRRPRRGVRDLSARGRARKSVRLGRLRDRLLDGLRSQLDGVVVNGSLERRLPNNLHVSFAGVDGESLLIGIGDIAVSSGSACSSASATPSHVLRAILGDHVPPAAIRFGLGRFTTEDEIDYAIEKFTTVVRHLRGVAPAVRS